MLDEATSALDNQTESEVMSAINNLTGEKTIIMIAHRLSTLRNCDRIFVLDLGEISQVGSWDTLTQTEGTFKDLLGSIKH